ncbi:threonine-phosphate decarboxylase CobD [Thiocapsa sp.]|uniref:threonine-phosphate decarboxylase CobD n=1 Tax=Thiocapsa sp. TaxID=2024551 RepID=UPI0025EBE943|nr:threonine-phosphate decarboxylase CobD [Thiocapsa sp.]
MIAIRSSTAGSLAPTPLPLEHGGRLRAAAARYRIPVEDWLDLSTGINPDGWPVPEVPGTAWARLPEEDDGLEEAAARCYCAPGLLPVAGSQAAIQALPQLRVPGRVGVPTVGYQEHAQAWQRAGHTLVSLDDGNPGDELGAGPDSLDVLVVINPNNPTGRRWSVSRLLEWHAQLAARGGWLLVDEAFMDTTPQDSLARYTERPGLIVLRSLGKFYGLAGVRVGFVLGTPDLREALRARLGPWTLSGPARHVARLALADSPWQEATRASLRLASTRLAGLLSDYGLVPTGATDLFQWVCTAEAPAIQDRLARQGIWVRRFDVPSSLRFGLPGAEASWARLESGLRCLASDARGDAFRHAAVEAPGIRPFSSAAPPLAPARGPLPGDSR